MRKKTILVAIITGWLVSLALTACLHKAPPTPVLEEKPTVPLLLTPQRPLSFFTTYPTPEPVTMPSPPPTAKPVVITFACFGKERAEYEQLAEKFQEANPGIKVQIIAVEDVLEIRAGWPEDAVYRMMSAADTAIVDVTWSDAEKGFFRDLQPFIEAEPDFNPDDFHPPLLEIFQWDGGTWALPGEVDFSLIFYDKDAFDEARIGHPQVGWTWEDFLEKARSLTAYEEGEVIRYGFVDPWASGSLGFVTGLAGSLVGESVQPPFPAFEGPAVAEALEFYVDMALEDGVMFNPYAEGVEPRQAFDLIERKKAAMWVEEASARQKRARDFNLGVVPFPKGKGSSNPLWARGLVMSAGTDHPQDCWCWLSFLTRERISPLSEGIPPRRSVAEETRFWDDLPAEVATAYHHVLENSLTWLPYRELSKAFYQAVRDALAKENEVEEALVSAQERVRQEVAALLGIPTTPVSVATPRAKPTKVAETTIVFAAFLKSSEERQYYQNLAEAFSETHPDVAINLHFPEGTLSFKDMAAAVDCFQWEGPIWPRVSGVLTLDPLIEADAEFDLEDFYPMALEAFHHKGQLWGLPVIISPQVIFYNKDLFDEAGVEYPEPGWTWDDFFAKTVQLTGGEGRANCWGFVDRLYPSHTLAPSSILFPFIYHRVGFIETPPLALDDPRLTEAVSWYFNLSRKHEVMPIFASPSEENKERYTAITKGRAAMWVDLVEDVGYYKPRLAEKFRLGVVPLPKDGQGAATFTYLGYFISENTSHPRECWEWLKYLSENLLSEEMGRWGISARRSMAESPYFEEKVGKAEATAYLETLKYEPLTPASVFGLPLSGRAWYLRQEAFMKALEEIAAGAEIETTLGEAEMNIVE